MTEEEMDVVHNGGQIHQVAPTMSWMHFLSSIRLFLPPQQTQRKRKKNV